MEFTPIKNYNLRVAASGTSQSRILIFRTIKPDSNPEQWERVEGAQIIIVGQDAKAELTKLAKEHGRPAVSDMIPGGIAGRAYPALRSHLGLAK